MDSYRDTLGYRSAVLVGRAQGLADATDLLKLLNQPLLRARAALETTPPDEQPAVVCALQAEIAATLADVSRRLAEAHQEIAQEASLLSAEVRIAGAVS
ncbi:hypothetical protein ACO2Q3_14485 [Caulobacter sp. KR2-114]|uniref:hypothetical protein n=1 Tax=Caulobacter sp. KR2-114 TaxID=3400912 RepID=UPI003C089A4D